MPQIHLVIMITTKESLESGHEIINAASLYIKHKTANIKFTPPRITIGKNLHQAVEETSLNFTIGITKGDRIEAPVIAFNSEITALIHYGQSAAQVV